jgi:hypothetical protein
MKATIRNVCFAALGIIAFGCKNSSHDSGYTKQGSGSGGMESTDPGNSSNMNESNVTNDSTSTGTLSGDNGTQNQQTATGNSGQPNSGGNNKTAP